MHIADARAAAPTLDGAGFTLLAHRSATADFADRAALDACYRPEIIELIRDVSGADLVLVNSPGILRFSERSPHSGVLDNSRPARFAPRRRERSHGQSVRRARRASREAPRALRALQHLARHLRPAPGRAARGL
jgi:hypothetical protein